MSRKYTFITRYKGIQEGQIRASGRDRLESWSTTNHQCTYNVTLRHVRVTTVAVQKQWILHIPCTYVALVIQHAMRIIFLSVASHKRQTFRKKSYWI